MKLFWHPEAKEEADLAAEFYKDKRQGLEQKFFDNLEEALRRVQKHPALYKNIGDIRTCKLKRFPTALVFRLRSDVIEIIAIMHTRREPGYWNARMSRQSNSTR